MSHGRPEPKLSSKGANDRYPGAGSDVGEQLGPNDWQVVPTLVKRGAAIDANAT